MDTIKSLKADLAERDQRIKELREELTAERELIGRFREHVREFMEWRERLVEGWEITETEDGQLVSERGWDKAREIGEQFIKLMRAYNVYAGPRQPIGRPIAASEAQEKEVIRLRKKGISLREIAERTNLGLKTVRTIIAHAERTDTGTLRRAAILRVKVDRQPLVRLEARRKTRDIVRKQLVELNEQAKELLKL
jgi:hypothetical protein